jgi:hypothetical protein
MASNTLCTGIGGAPAFDMIRCTAKLCRGLGGHSESAGFKVMVAGPFVDGLVRWVGRPLILSSQSGLSVLSGRPTSLVLLSYYCLPGCCWWKSRRKAVWKHICSWGRRTTWGSGMVGTDRAGAVALFTMPGPHEEQNRSLCLPFRVKLGQEGWRSVG